MAASPQPAATPGLVTGEKKPASPRFKGASEGRRRDAVAAYLFLLPYLFVLIVFYLVTMLYGLGLSFYKVDIGFTIPRFVGIRNYQNLFNQLSYAADSDFWVSMVNVLKYTVFVVIGQTILGLLLALLLQTIAPRLRGLFRSVFYLPAVTSSVAVSLMFLWFYNPQGLINYMLSLLSLPGPHWLEDPNFALPAIMMLNIWTTSATFMLYFLAAIQDLPLELYEAARVDGANRWHLFLNLTIPLLRPTIFLVVALGTISSFQLFDQVKFMTEGGPLNSTLTPVLEIYNAAFKDNNFGLAASMSVLLFVVIFIVTIVQRRLIDVNN